MPGFAAAAELTCLLTARSEAFHPRAFIAGIVAITLCVFLIPLFVTGTWSCGAASTVCYERTFALQNATFFDVESPHYDPDWEMDDSASWYLFPAHLFNSTSTAASLFGLCVWLFFSPHLSVKDMDRTRAFGTLFDTHAEHPNRVCPNPQPGPVYFSFLSLPHSTPPLYLIVFPTVGSYFAIQWLANLLVTATALGSKCASSQTVNTALVVINVLATFSLSVIGTNLLCHRHPCEKARAMIQLCGKPLLLLFTPLHALPVSLAPPTPDSPTRDPLCRCLYFFILYFRFSHTQS
jgi:hypothetical protein